MKVFLLWYALLTKEFILATISHIKDRGDKMFAYIPTGVCTTEINFEIINNKIHSLSFLRGCPGNLLGLTSLIEGMTPLEAISKLEGIKCGNKSTSCPDQLAKALKEAIAGAITKL